MDDERIRHGERDQYRADPWLELVKWDKHIGRQRQDSLISLLTVSKDDDDGEFGRLFQHIKRLIEVA